MKSIKRDIKYIVIHSSGSSEKQTVKGLLDYWKKDKGWDAPGYHYAVDKAGDVHTLLEESKIANGVKGNNYCSVHIGWIGGLDKNGKNVNNITPAQEEGLFNKIVELSEIYPKAEILGHRDFPGVAKDCPLFDVKTWLRNYIPGDLDLAA